MVAGRMTQKQLVRHLAEKRGTKNKVARSFLDERAKVATRETKGGGISRVTGSGRLIKASRKTRMGRLATGVAIRGRAQKAIPGKDPALETLTEVFSHL